MYWETCDLNREEPIQRKSPFIDFWLCQVFIAVWAFLQLWQVGAALQLQCMGFSLQWLLQWEQNLQGMWAFIVAAPGVQSVHSIVVTLELGCSVECRIFLNQGSSPCLLHWQVDSLPLSHQGNPVSFFDLGPGIGPCDLLLQLLSSAFVASRQLQTAHK